MTIGGDSWISIEAETMENLLLVILMLGIMWILFRKQ